MTRTRATSSRRGVAIIIVVGLMAILMVMGVAFSIQMRVERAGAATYRHGIISRHMIWAGLANAIDDIDFDMDPGTGFDVYPTWSILQSTGDAPKTAAAVVSKEAVEYLPKAMRNEASSKVPYWHIIKDQNGLIRGRYAFTVANMSGLLDANRAGGDDRAAGTNAYEIQMAGLGDIGANADAFIAEATNDVRYETLPELRNCNLIAAAAPDLYNFATFSLARSGVYYNPSSNALVPQAFIGGPSAGWDSKQTIETALQNSKIYTNYRERVYLNMKDYADSDIVPESLTNCCGEPVPMANEFSTVLTATRSAGGDTVTLNWTHQAEWFYPFVQTGGSFRIEYAVKISATSAMTPAAVFPASAEYSTTSNFTVNTYSYGTVAISGGPLTFTISPATNPVTVAYQVMHSAKIFHAGDQVDDVPPTRPLRISTGALAANANVTTNCWMECIDPRFNWSPEKIPDGEALRQWWTGGYSMANLCGEEMPAGYVYGSSIGSQNHLLTAALLDKNWCGEKKAFFDEGLKLHVANTNFSSVGELGYIAMAPWESIRLISRKFPNAQIGADFQFQRVFDYFTVSKSQYSHGLVNMNTTNQDVLGSVFLDAPEEEFTPTCAFKVTDPMADILAAAIAARSPFTNYWNMQKAMEDFDWSTVVANPDNDISIESPIRNSMGLFTLGQNLFTVFIRSDSFSEELGGYGSGRTGITLASARAVAEIWRDPFRDENGNHRCFIRMFRYLDE